jgi:hypothetical protein
MFCATNECNNDSKNGVSYQNRWLPENIDTNKNVIEMGVIINGVYCILNNLH